MLQNMDSLECLWCRTDRKSMSLSVMSNHYYHHPWLLLLAFYLLTSLIFSDIKIHIVLKSYCSGRADKCLDNRCTRWPDHMCLVSLSSYIFIKETHLKNYVDKGNCTKGEIASFVFFPLFRHLMGSECAQKKKKH